MLENSPKTVVSSDGTTIGYEQRGMGPGLILIQGTMGTAYNFKELSELLASSFTVYTPDRRGRGMSGKGQSEYGIQREVEDVEALLQATNTQYVFGLSSGAVIALQTALVSSAIHKLAIFEPALFANKEDIPVRYVEEYNQAITQDKVAAALIAGMKAGQFAPPIMNAIPNKWLEALVKMGIRQEIKKGTKGYAPMSELAYTLGNDFQLVGELSGKLEDYKAVTIPTLLLGGSKSQTYLKNALNALEMILPNATRVELAGLNHGAAWNSDRRGAPDRVAIELRKFFLGD